MLPFSLWVLLIAIIDKTQARSDLAPRAIRFSNTTSSSSSTISDEILETSPTSSLVASQTQNVVTSESSNPASDSVTSRLPLDILSSRTRLASILSRLSTRSSRSIRNDTVATNVPTPCCFVIQDTVSEDWWKKTSFATETSLVDLTSYTTYLTRYPNATRTNVETNVYPTNATSVFKLLVGPNPISNQINLAPSATEVTEALTGTEIVTAGVTIPSPAGFYVYNTVKIITAEPVTDRDGNLFCATASIGARGDIFPRVNGNAQAYFGGSGIVDRTAIPTGTSTETVTVTIINVTPSTYTTYETWTNMYDIDSTVWLDRDGATVTQSEKPTGVIISMVTPFIYVPPRGAKPIDTNADTCTQDADTEAYGYIPQTLIEYLAGEPYYSSQYPGIENCYGGGPSIIQIWNCGNAIESSSYQTAIEDLTSSTTIYVNVPSMHQDTTTGEGIQTFNGDQIKVGLPTDDRTPLGAPPRITSTTSLYTVPPDSVLADNSNSDQNNSPADGSNNGEIITISHSTTMPLSLAPGGAVGISTNINSTPVLIVGPTTITQHPTTTIPPAQQQQQGEQPITITAATTIPLSLAPAGASGMTTTINNTPMLIIASPTTILPPVQSLLLTTIPLSLASVGATGRTTIVDGSTYLVLSVPSSTASANLGEIKTITTNGVTELFISGPVTIPVNSLFDVKGRTTVISGVTEVIVESATTIVEISVSSGSSTRGSMSGSGSSSGSSGTNRGGTNKVQSTSTSQAAAAHTAYSGCAWVFEMAVGVLGVGFVLGL